MARFQVSGSNDGLSLVIKLPLDQVLVDLYDLSPRGVSVAWELAKVLDEIYAPSPGEDPVSPFQAVTS